MFRNNFQDLPARRRLCNDLVGPSPNNMDNRNLIWPSQLVMPKIAGLAPVTRTLSIRKGKLQNIKADILVYTISCDLDFSKRALSKTMLQAAGNGMQRFFQNNSFVSDSMIVTEGFGLPCNKVFHLCLPSFTGNNNFDIQNYMEECLQEAASINASSIAFSSLGTGQLRYPKKVVSNMMLTTAHQHLLTSTNLKEISIIIYWKDNHLFRIFEEEANVLPPNPLIKINIERNESKISAPMKMLPDFIIGDVQIYLICGNLLHEKTDAIVHCTDAKFSCNGAISRCLIKHFGRAFTDDCQRKSSEMMRNHFAVTDAHGLQCKMIFHLDIVSHLSEPEKILETCIFNAEKYGISSLSIPHLSTYGKSIPLDKMASAIVKVFSKLKSRYLKQINVVLYQAKFVSTLKQVICREQGTPVPQMMTPSKILERKPLQSNDPEYQTVLTNFLSGLKRSASIKSIEKIINKPLKIQYDAQLQKIKALNSGSTQNERILWHGTKADIVEKICQDGFDRGYCGANGTWHGQGVYFAVYSEYSDKDTYTPRDSNGYKHMLMCNVATGAYTQGTPTMKVLPTRPNSSQKYDSAVNNPINPTVFIIFNDVQAYPAYYITYS